MGPLIPVALSVLPALAEWLGGARAGDVAERAAGVVRAVTGTDDPAAAAAALSDPAKWAEAQIRLAEIAGQERDAYLADVANARAQTIALAQAGSGIAWAAPVVSVVVTLGFFAAVAMVFLVQREWDERTAGILNVLLGALVLGFGQVVNYWLGSSAGSKRAGDAVRQIATQSEADRLNAASLSRARGNP